MKKVTFSVQIISRTNSSNNSNNSNNSSNSSSSSSHSMMIRLRKLMAAYKAHHCISVENAEKCQSHR